jgi:hypothetical protein
MGGDWERTGADMTVRDNTLDRREIVSASFDEWLTHVFNHELEPAHWRWNEDFVEWAAPSATTVDFLCRTFEDCGTLFKRFTQNQIAIGLWYIASGSLSKIGASLWDESVPWPARRRSVRSIRKLYSDCFAVHCAPLLSYLEKKRDYPSPYPPLNGTCFMWWDLFDNLLGLKKPTGNEIENECLAVMEYALGLESIACQESALHGLGHCSRAYPEFVRPAIDRFIKTNPNASPELIHYALAARDRYVS